MAQAASVQKVPLGGRAPAVTCAARTRRGTPCERGAGWGTDHPGYGQCRNHGGRTESGRKHAAKLMAIDQARRDFGGEHDVNPLDAMLYTVRRGQVLAMYWRNEAVAKAADPEAFALAARAEARALDDLNRWSHGAVKAGVAERLVQITERTAERLAGAFEEALAVMAGAGVVISGDQRAAAVRAYSASLYALEAGDVVEGHAADVIQDRP